MRTYASVSDHSGKNKWRISGSRPTSMDIPRGEEGGRRDRSASFNLVQPSSQRESIVAESREGDHRDAQYMILFEVKDTGVGIEPGGYVASRVVKPDRNHHHQQQHYYYYEYDYYYATDTSS